MIFIIVVGPAIFKKCHIVNGPFWTLLGPFWALLGLCWALLGLFWAVLGSFWVLLGGSCGRYCYLSSKNAIRHLQHIEILPWIPIRHPIRHGAQGCGPLQKWARSRPWAPFGLPSRPQTSCKHWAGDLWASSNRFWTPKLTFRPSKMCLIIIIKIKNNKAD